MCYSVIYICDATSLHDISLTIHACSAISSGNHLGVLPAAGLLCGRLAGPVSHVMTLFQHLTTYSQHDREDGQSQVSVSNRDALAREHASQFVQACVSCRERW